MEMATKSPSTDYKVFASYDEGSAVFDSISMWGKSLEFYTTKFLIYALPYILIIIGFVAILFAIALYIVYLWPRKKRRIDFISSLLKDIIKIRKVLRNDEKYRAKIETSGEWINPSYEFSHQLFQPENYINIDDFYAKLTFRNTKIEAENISIEELVKTNKDIVSLADNAFKNINLPQFSLFDNIIVPILLRIGIVEEEFIAELSGIYGLPANYTKAWGTAEFKKSDVGTIPYKIILQNIAINKVHIHKGARSNIGDMVVSLSQSNEAISVVGSWEIKGHIKDSMLEGPLKGKLIADLVKIFEANEAYVDVHSFEYPEGEIRGRIFKQLDIKE